jgi:hypothetical protein
MTQLDAWRMIRRRAKQAGVKGYVRLPQSIVMTNRYIAAGIQRYPIQLS